MTDAADKTLPLAIPALPLYAAPASRNSKPTAARAAGAPSPTFADPALPAFAAPGAIAARSSKGEVKEGARVKLKGEGKEGKPKKDPVLAFQEVEHSRPSPVARLRVDCLVIQLCP